MSRWIKTLCLFGVIGGIVLGGPFACKSKSPAGGGPAWVTIDENYQPRDPVEVFIKQDSANRSLLPVSIINYGNDEAVLKRFKGSNYAMPKPAVLRMFFKGLRDWKVVDLKYLNEKKREVNRTILYVLDGEAWKVADSGSLIK